MRTQESTISKFSDAAEPLASFACVLPDKVLWTLSTTLPCLDQRQSSLPSTDFHPYEQHRQYLADHPALTELLHDLLTNCMVNKPEDPFQFCRDYFYGLSASILTSLPPSFHPLMPCRELKCVRHC